MICWRRIIRSCYFLSRLSAFSRMYASLSAVELLDHLFVEMRFFEGRVIVGRPDDLCDAGFESITEFMKELLGGKRVRAIAIGNKEEILRKLLIMTKSHAHGHNTGGRHSRYRRSGCCRGLKNLERLIQRKERFTEEPGTGT